MKQLPLLLVFFLSVCYCTPPLVKTTLGAIRGYYKTSHDGRKFAAFEGIPFAKPPIGDRRFEEAEPVDPWTGTWDAKYLITCAQTTITQPNVTEGVEDCLYINVYVPRENFDSSEKLDVVVHVHGGAYMYASGHMYAKPEYIMDRDLIFVTFNYRLGILGFLSTEDEVVPGNMGLKDQVLALKWVKNNIASFGGNPNSVTLTGLSAGASGAHFHYFSPLSKDLFHRGFSQSGVATNCWSLQEEALGKAKRVGESLGCPIVSTQDLVKCLKEKPVGQILDKVRMFLGYKFLPLAPFAPVVEKKGPRPFLSDFPYSLLKKKMVLDVPWISSNTADEGLLPLNIFGDDFDNLNQNWKKLASSILDFNYTLPREQHEEISEKVLEYYIGKNQISKENLNKMIKMFGDRIFVVDSEGSTRLQAKATKSPIYYYFFTYLGDVNQEKLAGHGEDAKYFFGNVFKQPGPLTTNELKMKDIMLDMLASFAKTGVPKVKEIEWTPTQADQLTYLEIGGFESEKIKIKKTSDLTGTREFWNSLGLTDSENFFLGKTDL